mmetsp:Transcript_112188/g.317798  ORF Transcript_112188/g.317798 Transcript_112188/m.317798 type:complete len:173 (+) Transcript_112188:52-570(+)
MANAVAESWHDCKCHCGGIHFRVLIPDEIDVYRCDCSICWMKQNHHFVVTKEKIDIVRDDYREYTFNTNTARHRFCQNCGVTAYYVPRSNPDGFAVTIYCLDVFNPENRIVERPREEWPAGADVVGKSEVFLSDGDKSAFTVVWHFFCGQNWEQQIATSSIVDKTPAGGGKA